MRKLKFRAWDKLAERFIFPDKGYQGHYTLDLNGRFYNLHNGSSGDEYVVQQYTGLKDKNNVEIYEGDVVTYQQPYRASRLTHPATTDSYRTIIAPVIYNKDSFQFEIDSYPIGTPMIKTRKDLKIIGNIFENPELLK